MGPLNRYSMAAVAAAVLIGLLFHPSGPVVVALVLLVLAIHLFVWDSERRQMFSDDWLEMAQIAASLFCALAAIVLLLAACVSSLI